jgi:hypothetical protein
MRRRIVCTDRMIEASGNNFVTAHEYCADGYFAGCTRFFGGGLGECHEVAVAFGDDGDGGYLGTLFGSRLSTGRRNSGRPLIAQQ